MKLHKIFLFAALAFATALTSCSDDDAYSAGKPAGENNVTFADGSSIVLASSATSFDVALKRTNTTSALEVPLQVITSNGFTFPEKAVFAAGDSITTVSVGVPADMKFNTTYEIEIRIPEEYTNPYLIQSTCPIYKVGILKEDYAVKYTGKLNDTFWYEESWDVELEYSPSQDLYRIKDMFVDGYNFYFKWNAETNVITATDANGATVKYFDTGIYNSTYGENIVGNTNQAKFYYDPATKTIHLPIYWYLLKVGGGWGIYEDIIVLD